MKTEVINPELVCLKIANEKTICSSTEPADEIVNASELNPKLILPREIVNIALDLY
ncbi:hypothetical protein VSA01S_09510 [Vibrio sagamiensis NBRC 104589]|uniref:Uncharacterized protein n=1 Tax=Vibrio sagamiensis NBRC 104589 TaxID=1219064 RepID=A0A511QC16_9VIBR|nr:hypothetical protein VSA01S_09510 [Vibrio sagamiensis NBRC 104589]